MIDLQDRFIYWAYLGHSIEQQSFLRVYIEILFIDKTKRLHKQYDCIENYWSCLFAHTVKLGYNDHCYTEHGYNVRFFGPT